MKKYIFIFLIIFLTSCVSFVAYREKVELSLNQNKYDEAITCIKKASNDKDRVLSTLLLGSLYHYKKDYKESISYFQKAERYIEELTTKSLSKEAFSYLINDNTLPYAGEDYENIYLNVFSALNYLKLNEFDEAMVELRRVDHKLSVLEQKYAKECDYYNKSQKNISFKVNKAKFYNDVLSRYLSMLCYKAENKIDDVIIDKEKILKAWKTQSHIYNYSMPSCIEKNSEKPCLNVLSFVGKSPVKEASEFSIHTLENIAVISSSSGRKDFAQIIVELPIEPDLQFKFAIPYLVSSDSQVRKIKVFENNVLLGELFLLEDIEKVVSEVYEVKKSLIFFKAVLRSLGKSIAAHKVKEKLTKGKEDTLFDFMVQIGTAVTVNLSEQADLRCWYTLPEKCLVGEFELPVGKHNIKIKYYDQDNNVIYEENSDIEIKENKINLLTSYYLK